tara:strand:+ start:120 stop:386 length:267 start_codon:yes stop_codon:yes gene_type:complete
MLYCIYSKERAVYRGKVVHFFGFRGVEYISAVRVWGKPDFIHPVHDRRAYIEYDSVNDIGVFANKETEDRIHSYRREYADMLGVDKTV